MSFTVGDRVEALDEDIRGIVVGVSGDLVTIEDLDGFPLQYSAKELILEAKDSEIRVTSFEVAQVKSEKEQKKRKQVIVKSKERNAPKMEVDLHISKLVKSYKGMSNYDMLNLQLETAKRQLDFAMSKRIQKIVFIHGVGEGVLKIELEYLFKRYENLKFYAADYQKYGSGATEVYVFQN